MVRSKTESPFTGRWRIVSMDTWDIEDDESASIEFDDHGAGSFQFASVEGVMDCRLTTRGQEPAVEWTWEGGDEDDPATGRGWAVRTKDELHGQIVIHMGEESGFVAKKPGKSPRSKKPK